MNNIIIIIFFFLQLRMKALKLKPSTVFEPVTS